MSWDAAIHGRIRIPEDQREAWLDCKLDWPAVDGHDVWDGYVGAETVREVVEAMGFADDMEFMEFEWDGDELRVASFQAKDGFNETAITIAAAWAAAAAFGGKGELVAMGMLTASFGYRLTVGGGKATFSEVPEREVGKLDNHPDAKAIEKRVGAMGEELGKSLMGEDAWNALTEDTPKKKKKAGAKKKAAKKAGAKKKSAAKKKPAAKKKSAAKKKPAAKKKSAAKKKPAAKKKSAAKKKRA
jgi:hypothetical protein